MLRLAKASDAEATEQCYEPESASLTLAEQVDSDEYDKNKVYRKGRSNRNLLRLTSFPQGRTEQSYEPESASLTLAEQVDSDEYNKKKVYRKGRSNSNRYLAKGEYTHALRLTSELVDLRAGYANLYSEALPRSRSILTSTIKRRSTARADLLFMAPATGIEPVTNP